MATPTQENYGATPDERAHDGATGANANAVGLGGVDHGDAVGRATARRCPCPPGCAGDCAVRSHWLFNEKENDLRTIHTLQSTSNPPRVKLERG